MPPLVRKFWLLLLLFLLPLALGFDYALKENADLQIRLSTVGFPDIASVFLNENVSVTVLGIRWNRTASDNAALADSDNLILWDTFVDDELIASGTFDVSRVNRNLPYAIPVGTIQISTRGSHTIDVKLKIDDSSAFASRSYQAYRSWSTMIPILVIVFLTVVNHKIELSLFAAILVGAVMVSGNLVQGFRTALDTYILGAMVQPSHGYVCLYLVFISGLVAMFEKSGGLLGFTHDISKIAKTPRMSQMVSVLMGFSIFFEDTTSVLLVGQTMRPINDLLSISREKLAFIVNSVAAPIASTIPFSSWVGVEVGLIQHEIDRIIVKAGTTDIWIDTSGFGVFIRSLQYRYYPIFLLYLVVILIAAQRDMGGMLVAERKTHVYGRADGGPGGVAAIMEDANNHAEIDILKPKSDTPRHAHNLILPVLLLDFMILWLFIKTGERVGDQGQSFVEKIENADSYRALLWGSMATVLATMLLYTIQIVKNSVLVLPSREVVSDLVSMKEWDQDEIDTRARVLVSVTDSIEALLHGMSRVFRTLVVLVLAWASADVMDVVGTDRFFSTWVDKHAQPETLPTLYFLMSFFMALAIGNAWATMTILFPMALVPAYDMLSDEDATVFYAVIASLISGSVAGQQVSPISSETILCAKACACGLLAHVTTQGPYNLAIVIISILCGTIPIGFGIWPNLVGIFFGWIAIVLFTFACCAPIVSPTGQYDIFTFIYMKTLARKKSVAFLEHLQSDTIGKAAGLSPCDDNGEVHGISDTLPLEKSAQDMELFTFLDKASVIPSAAAVENGEYPRKVMFLDETADDSIQLIDTPPPEISASQDTDMFTLLDRASLIPSAAAAAAVENGKYPRKVTFLDETAGDSLQLMDTPPPENSGRQDMEIFTFLDRSSLIPSASAEDIGEYRRRVIFLDEMAHDSIQLIDTGATRDFNSDGEDSQYSASQSNEDRASLIPSAAAEENGEYRRRVIFFDEIADDSIQLIDTGAARDFNSDGEGCRYSESQSDEGTASEESDEVEIYLMQEMNPNGDDGPNGSSTGEIFWRLEL